MCVSVWKKRERERDEPWKVGGRQPKLSSSNSTESILYLGICSAIMGFAILLAVLQIACEDWIVVTLKKLLNREVAQTPQSHTCHKNNFENQ